MLINDYTSAAAGGGAFKQVPLFWWQGYSCAWYVSSVFDLTAFDCEEKGTFVLVRRETDGRRTPLFVGRADNVSDALYTDFSDALIRAIKAGASEVHVHLAADHDWQRDEMLNDIAEGWNVPRLIPNMAA